MSVPQHSATAPIRFILVSDPAWDLEPIEAERKRLGARSNEHPIPCYFSGEHRFDMDAPGPVDEGTKTPRDYLRPGSKPRAWLLRRLGIVDVARIDDIGGHLGELEAFAAAVIGCENLPDGVTAPEQGSARRLMASQVDDLAAAVGMDEVFAVGKAALLASRAPTSAEKKP